MQSVVFIHGMYMTPLCWEGWVEHFAAQGYSCQALAWPGRDQPVAALRARHPDPQLATLTFSAVLEHLATQVRALAEPPILIGHSMGGLLVQQLLQRGLGSAGVAVDSAPPRGVLTTKLSFLKANWPHLNPLASKRTPVQMSFAQFQYAFVNGLPLDVQRAAYERYVVPESRRVPAAVFTSASRIDFKRQRAPLLLIAGANDTIVPAALNRSNFKKYAGAPAVTDFKVFPNRTHFITGQDGWQEVADYTIAWLREHVPHQVAAAR